MEVTSKLAKFLLSILCQSFVKLHEFFKVEMHERCCKNYQVIAKNSQKPKKVLFNLLYFHLFADSENFDVRKQKKISQKKEGKDY